MSNRTWQGGTGRVPDVSERPTLTVVEAGQFLGLSRDRSYHAARNGTLPTIMVSPGRKVVPTAALRKMLQLDDE